MSVAIMTLPLKWTRATQLAEHSITTISDDDEVPQTAYTARQKLVKQIHESLRSLDETIGTGTGAVRRLHYEGKFHAAPAGNSANADAAAKQRNSLV